MALPNIMRRLFRNDGYGPLLKPEIIPFASDLSSKDGSVAASTEWVKNLAVAHVYVDAANGSDSNGGFSASDATATIGKALEIAFGKDPQHAVLHIAGGSYTENIELTQQDVSVTILGNVSLNGYINLIGSSFIIEDSTYTFSVSNSDASTSYGTIGAWRNSLLMFNCPVSVTASAYIQVFACYNTSVIGFSSTLSVSVSNTGRVFVCHDSSQIFSNGDVSVTGSFTSNLLEVFGNSSVYFNGKVTCASGLFTGSNFPINCRYSSVIVFTDIVTIYSTTSTSCNYLVYIHENSTIAFNGAVNLYFKPTSGISAIAVINNSNLIFQGTAVKIEVANTSDILRVISCSCALIYPTSLNLSGNISYSTVNVQNQSYMLLDNATTVTGTVTGARRYTVIGGSQINVEGAGANRIPGASAGFVNSSNYGYYG